MGRIHLNCESPVRRAPSVLFNDMGGLGFAAIVMFALFVIAIAHRARDRGYDAKPAAAKTDVAMLHGAVSHFELDMGRLPTSAEGLDVLLVAPSDGAGKWHGPYLHKLRSDPWAQRYVYHQPGDRNGVPFNVISFGPDKRLGGGDDITD